MPKYNFPVNSRVQLYRTERNPLGGAAAQIPVKGSTGTVIRDVYYSAQCKAWCVCVRWDLPHGGVWTVRCTNLKIVNDIPPIPAENNVPPVKKEEVKVEEVKPKGKWDGFKEKANSLVSYIFNGIEVPSDICFYKCFGTKKFDNFAIYFRQFSDKIPEDAKRYYAFLFNESHFKDVFVSKDVNDYRDGPVEFNVKDKHRLHIISSAVWCRMAWEFDKFVTVWNDCVKAGVNPHFAMLVASIFRNGNMSIGDGHTPIYGIDNAKQFVDGKFHLDANKMYGYNGNNRPMGCKLGAYLADKGAVGKNEYGYLNNLEWNSDHLIPLIIAFQKEQKIA